MAKDPAFLFYYKDFDSDTADWEPEAIGWYVRLLCFQAANGYIPSDIEELAVVARVKFSDFEKFRDRWASRIASKFNSLGNKKILKPNVGIRILRNSGIHHPNFKGIYDANMKIRQSPQYRRFKLKVLERDNRTCQMCGDKNKIHVHHIKPFASFPNLRFDVNNGLSLCQPCHIKVHKND